MDLIEQKYLLYYFYVNIGCLSILGVGVVVFALSSWWLHKKGDETGTGVMLVAALVIFTALCFPAQQLIKIQSFPELFLSENSKDLAKIRQNLEESRNERAID